jgi:hypothetical protein
MLYYVKELKNKIKSFYQCNNAHSLNYKMSGTILLSSVSKLQVFLKSILKILGVILLKKFKTIPVETR